MARKAQFTPEEIKARRNARRVKYQRRRMQDPEYRERQQKMWRDWYAKKGKARVVEGVRQWRERNPHRYLFAGKKTNALRRGIEWSIEFEEIVWPTHCPVLGIELDYGRKNRSATDNSPSFDRVFNEYGYVPGNVIVISQLANRIKNSATPEQLAQVAEYFSKITEARRPTVTGECRCATCQQGTFEPRTLHGRAAVEAYIAACNSPKPRDMLAPELDDPAVE